MPFAPAVQPEISIVTFLHPPPTELTCVLVDHHRLSTLVANKPNIKDAIVPKVIAVHRFGSGMQPTVPASVLLALLGHLNRAISVVIPKRTSSIMSNCRECKNDALVGQSQPKPINHAAFQPIISSQSIFRHTAMHSSPGSYERIFGPDHFTFLVSIAVTFNKPKLATRQCLLDRNNRSIDVSNRQFQTCCLKTRATVARRREAEAEVHFLARCRLEFSGRPSIIHTFMTRACLRPNQITAPGQWRKSSRRRGPGTGPAA